MALYVTREGPVPTLDVWNNLSTYGGQTLNAITVPAGYGSIKEIWVSAGPNGGATDNQGCTFAIRLVGSGLKYGPVDIVVGAWSHLLTGNTGDSMFHQAMTFPVDIALNPQGEIWVKGTQTGAADIGTPEIAVTCVFTKQGGGLKYYLLRDMNVAGVDNTVYQMTHSVDDTAAGKFRVPAGCTKVTKIFGACGGIIADATGGSMAVRLKGTGLPDGEVVMPIGGYSEDSTTTGVHGCYVNAVVVPTDLRVTPGGDISAESIFSGTDVTTPDVAVSLEFSG